MTVTGNLGRLILFLLTFAACTGVNEKQAKFNGFNPDSIIPQNRMVCIMTDMHILEAGLLLERNQGKPSRERAVFLYRELFQKYEVSRELYDYSLRYYTSEPKVISEMYVRVRQQLEEKKGLLERNR